MTRQSVYKWAKVNTGRQVIQPYSVIASRLCSQQIHRQQQQQQPEPGIFFQDIYCTGRDGRVLPAGFRHSDHFTRYIKNGNTPAQQHAACCMSSRCPGFFSIVVTASFIYFFFFLSLNISHSSSFFATLLFSFLKGDEKKKVDRIRRYFPPPPLKTRTWSSSPAKCLTDTRLEGNLLSTCLCCVPFSRNPEKWSHFCPFFFILLQERKKLVDIVLLLCKMCT